MSKILAIKGDKERGHEVIALLEMLGGKNSAACGDNEKLYYFIGVHNIINADDLEYDSVIVFTLDEYYKKYPYKVGDRVLIPEYESEVRINQMKWDGWDMEYMVYRNDDEEWYTATELKWNDDFYDTERKVEPPVRDRDDILFNSIIWHLRNSVNNGKQYLSGGDCEAYFRELVKKVNENDMESCKCPEFEDIKKVAYLSINNKEYADEIEINLGNDYEIKIRDGKTYAVKKKPVYPKTYEECCKIKDTNSKYDIPYSCCENDYSGQLIRSLNNFRKLLICRDAYWKIAGEEMGLNKPWEPDWKHLNRKSYCIYNSKNDIVKNIIYTENKILAFPTEEIRNAFYENFKDLIEKCKELL